MERSIRPIWLLGRSLHMTTLVVAVVLVMSAMFGSTGAADAQGTTIERSVQINALADASWCEPAPAGETCYQLNLDIGAPNREFQSGLCLTLDGIDPEGNFTSEEGCADTSSTFHLNPEDLSTASLESTAVDLITWVCDPDTGFCDPVHSRTVTLGATWTAVGDEQKIIGRVEEPPSGCIVHDKIKTLVQNVPVALALDGVAHDGTGNLQVLEIKERRFCQR